MQILRDLLRIFLIAKSRDYMQNHRSSTFQIRWSTPRSFVTLLALSLASFLAGQTNPVAQGPASVAQAPPPAQAGSASQDYMILPDDLLDVYILDVPELSRTYRVSMSGQVTFPLISKPLSAAGLTLGQFEQLLSSELRSSGTLTHPQVNISVKESRLHSVSVTGAVKRAQIYPVFGKTKLLAVLSQAEGLSDSAGSIVKIIRGAATSKGLENPATKSPDDNTADNGQTISINLNDLFAGKDENLNVDVYPGDWVTVPPASVVYVIGAVNKSGGFMLTTNREHVTVLQALALAEDLKNTARRENAMIIRRGASGTQDRQEIAINLKNILKGESPDIAMQANDILFVPDSGGKRAMQRGAEAIIQAATGMAIYRHP